MSRLNKRESVPRRISSVIRADIVTDMIRAVAGSGGHVHAGVAADVSSLSSCRVSSLAKRFEAAAARDISRRHGIERAENAHMNETLQYRGAIWSVFGRGREENAFP